MKAALIISDFLTNNLVCRVCFLTLIVGFVLTSFQVSHATDYTADIPGVPVDSGYNNREQDQRMGLLLDYARKQSPAWVQGLLNNIHDPGHWAQNELGFGSDDEEKENASFLAAGQHAPLVGYKWMQFDAHPLYGHNPMHPQGYLGGEISANFGQEKSTPISAPLGKISLSYINDDSTSSGHGLDLRGALNFNENLSFNAGIRQNDIAQSGDYIMLRWKLIGN